MAIASNAVEISLLDEDELLPAPAAARDAEKSAALRAAMRNRQRKSRKGKAAEPDADATADAAAAASTKAPAAAAAASKKAPVAAPAAAAASVASTAEQTAKAALRRLYLDVGKLETEVARAKAADHLALGERITKLMIELDAVMVETAELRTARKAAIARLDALAVKLSA